MDTRKNRIQIIVCETDIHNGQPTYSLLGFQKWLSDQVAKVPDEFLDTAEIWIEGRESYDLIDVGCTIKYDRMETDEEVAARMASESARRKTYDAIERAEFERLKQKFEGQ